MHVCSSRTPEAPPPHPRSPSPHRSLALTASLQFTASLDSIPCRLSFASVVVLREVLSARRFTRLPLVEPEWIAGCQCWNTARRRRSDRWSWFSVAKPEVSSLRVIDCSRQRRIGTQPSLCKVRPGRSKVTHSASSTHGRNNIFIHNTPSTHPIPPPLHGDARSLHPPANYLLMWLISFSS